MYTSSSLKSLRNAAIALAIAALAAPATAQVNATAEIDAHREFVLGDYASKDYTARLYNRGPVAVEVRTFMTASGELVGTFELAAKQRKTVRVKKEHTVVFVNDSDRHVDIDARLSYGVEGMSSRPITEL